MDRRVPIVIAITGLSLMGCCCCGPIQIPQAAPVRPNDNAAKKDRQRRGVKDAGVVAKGKVVLTQNGLLAAADPADPTPDLKEVNAKMKVHEVQMQAGKTYVVTLNSNEFDPYLRIESPTGDQLEEDDDSGGALNSKIVFRPNQAGAYRVIATSWDGQLGRYQLKVQEAN